MKMRHYNQKNQRKNQQPYITPGYNIMAQKNSIFI